MNNSRRNVLKKSTAMAALLLQTLTQCERVYAYQQNAFDAKTIADLNKSLGLNLPLESSQITINTPEIAENGAVVQLAATTTLANIRRWIFVVEKNPVPLVAIFNLSEDLLPSITARAKFAQTSDFIAFAQLADGRVFYGKREVKVTLGGCGG
jgi:sulfur-oxidizing protein SoxY